MKINKNCKILVCLFLPLIYISTNALADDDLGTCNPMHNGAVFAYAREIPDADKIECKYISGTNQSEYTVPYIKIYKDGLHKWEKLNGGDSYWCLARPGRGRADLCKFFKVFPGIVNRKQHFFRIVNNSTTTPSVSFFTYLPWDGNHIKPCGPINSGGSHTFIDSSSKYQYGIITAKRSSEICLNAKVLNGICGDYRALLPTSNKLPVVTSITINADQSCRTVEY